MFRFFLGSTVEGGIAPSGIASAEAFGTAAVSSGQTITCTGIASTEAFGTAQLNLQVLPSAISSIEAFGTPLFILYLLPTGIASSESLGDPTLSVGAVDFTPSSITT